MNSLLPGSVIGILGGGQLGRMLAVAAAQLGYSVHIYCPEKNNPAEQVSSASTHSEYENQEALSEFAKVVDVVTYEFENIPVETVNEIAQTTAVYPNSEVLKISQDRLSEKTFINKIGIDTAPYKAVSKFEEALQALGEIGYPAVLKTRRFGYDGKGQAIVRSQADLELAWTALGNDKIIIEGFIDFDMEISVLAVRGQDGEVRCFAPVENEHKNHILDLSIAPARIDADLKAEAISKATKIIENIDYVGVLTVEFFVSAKEPKLRVNEIAPRVHNSGHWTIEACSSSQFEQHIRAICGLPLGDTKFIGEARMNNLIGDDIFKMPEILAEVGAHVHHYGKSVVKEGRKMGHVTRLDPGDR